MAMIQIRNVPDELHRKLKSRAALAGMSLSDYLLVEIRRWAALPTPDEVRERLARRGSVVDESSVQIIREQRGT